MAKPTTKVLSSMPFKIWHLYVSHTYVPVADASPIDYKYELQEGQTKLERKKTSTLLTFFEIVYRSKFFCRR